MEIKIIKSEAEHIAALAQLAKMLDKEYVSGSKEANALELLLLVIQDYERRNEKPLELDPLEAIKFRMEQMHLSKKDLIPFIGSESKVSEIFSGKRRLSLSMIRRLHEGLGIPLKSLVISRLTLSSKRRRIMQRKTNRRVSVPRRTRKRFKPLKVKNR